MPVDGLRYAPIAGKVLGLASVVGEALHHGCRYEKLPELSSRSDGTAICALKPSRGVAAAAIAPGDARRLAIGERHMEYGFAVESVNEHVYGMSYEQAGRTRQADPPQPR